MDLEEIIIKAIPTEICPQKNAAAMHRREILRIRINQYVRYKIEQLNESFNNPELRVDKDK